MRVLMLSKACLVGPYQKKLEELACQPNLQLTVAVPEVWRDRAGTLTLERQHLEGYRLVVEPVAFNGNYHLHFYPGLARLLRQVHPDLVHVDEEPYNLATAHAIWLARRAGARSLFFSWQNLLRRYPPPFRWFERYVLHHVVHAIVGNQDAGDVWRAKGYAGPLTVVPQFGVDPLLYGPDPGPPQASGAPRPFTVGFVGRLVEEKGVDLLLEALAGLEGDWRAIVIGSGPASGRLADQARQQGLTGRVAFAGPVPAGQMPERYRQMDVLVLPSRTRPNWREQFGRALVEAMACGVPVVGSDSGEIPRVIADAGVVFPEGQAAALCERLARLRESPSLRLELSAKGRQRVLAHYTQAHIARQTYQVWLEALSSPK